jgi:glyoxylase-like metal-dependent hydrolase (beta-lactamase superfamily II)
LHGGQRAGRERRSFGTIIAMRTGAFSIAVDRLAPATTGGVSRIANLVWRIVAPNPSPLTGPGTNTYVLGRNRPMVIDPGSRDPAHLERILDVAGGSIDQILCTHSHPDHSPGAAELRARTGASIFGLPPPRDPHQDPSYVPDAGLADGERIAAADVRLRVVHTPGHVSNHVCLLLEDEGMLFTGDHLMQGTTVVIIPPEGSMRDYLSSLRRLQGMSISSLAPGHGSVIADAQAEIARVIAHRLERESKLVAALSARGSASLDELLPVVYADVPASLHEWARHSLLAHAIKLIEDGRAAVAGQLYRWRG